MNREKGMGCYRCGGPVERVAPPDDASKIRTITVHLACRRCGQQYELQYSLAATFAVAASGEAEALLCLCERCGQMYIAQQDEPHLCRVAAQENEGEGT